VITTTKYPSWEVPTQALQIQDGGRPPSWKSWKIVNLSRGLSNLDEIGHDDAVRPSWTPRPLKFSKSNMASPAILKNLKIAIIQPRFGRFGWNLAGWCSSTHLTDPTVKNFKYPSWEVPTQALQIQDGGRRHLDKSKNRHISATVQPISKKFGTLVQFDPLRPPSPVTMSKSALCYTVGHFQHKFSADGNVARDTYTDVVEASQR